MSWWTSLTDMVKVAGNQLLGGVQWVWENATIANVGTTVFKFTANTSFRIMEQGLALRKAVPTLIYNEQARKVVNGMTYVVVHDVLPLVTINALNNGVQNYFRDGYDTDQASATYSLLISVLTMGNYLVTAYTWQRGVETLVRISVLDSFAPAAFNSNKLTPPYSKCTDLECNTQRRLKGMGRELGVLWANESLIGGISYIPYVGAPTAKVLKVINNGRYITRAATPERCERHKFMEQEFVLALGLTFELSCWLMDKGLNETIGPLPFLYLRTLTHILLALHVNLAAHMSIPLVESKDATLPVDLFNYYERVWRFVIDVFWAGLLKRVPIDFKPEPGAPPFIPLSSALQLGVRIFKSDLEHEIQSPPHPLVKKSKDILVPTMFRNAYDFTRDPVLAPYWPEIRKGALAIFSTVESYGKTKFVATMAWSPRTAAALLDLKFGIPSKLTKIVLMLSKEQDFWDLTHAVKSWFERHNVKTEVRLVEPGTPLLALCGDKELQSPPKELECTTSVAPVAQLKPEKTRSVAKVSEVVEVEQLITERPKSTSVLVSNNPAALLSARRRTTAAINMQAVVDQAQGTSLTLH